MSLGLWTGFPGGSDGKESACSVVDLGLIPGLGRFPGGGHGNPLWYSCLENPHGQRSLAGQKESDTTEQLNTTCRVLNGWVEMNPSFTPHCQPYHIRLGYKWIIINILLSYWDLEIFCYNWVLFTLMKLSILCIGILLPKMNTLCPSFFFSNQNPINM